jgi:hypothetical protein
MSYTPVGYLGDVTSGLAAGEINGIALLLADLRTLAARGHEFMQPGFRFSRSHFESMMTEYRPRSGETGDEAAERIGRRIISGEDIQTMIAGTVGAIAAALVRATGISRLQTATAEERATNHALQASIVDPARFMWDMLSETLRNMEARRDVATSGLGIAPIPIGIVVAVAVVGAIMGVTALASATYLADAFFRVQFASREAERICNRRGGCTATEEANIRRQLQLGPFDGAFQEFGRQAGEGLGTAIAVVGIGGAVVLGGVLWYFGLGGKQWIQEQASSRRQPYHRRLSV